MSWKIQKKSYDMTHTLDSDWTEDYEDSYENYPDCFALRQMPFSGNDWKSKKITPNFIL